MKFLKKFIIFIIAILLLALPPTQVFAARRLPTDMLSFFANNDIFYYNPKGAARGAGCYSGEINVYGTTVEEKIWTGLTSFMTPEQAAGVMGNMISESAFNPVRHETSFINKYPNFDIASDSSTSYGIGLIQWSFGRRINVINHIKSVAPELLYYLDEERHTYGRLSGGKFIEAVSDDVSNALIAVELEFLKIELDKSYATYYSIESVEEAAEYFLKQVERPALAHQPWRATRAQEYYDQLIDAHISDGSGTGNHCVNAGSLQEYVLLFAWPDYHRAPFHERTEAYAEAISRRQAEGKYVGGSVKGIAGIDCGGFVTTLIQESGFDPEYNTNKGSAANQELWARENGWVLLNDNPRATIDTSILQAGDVAFSDGSVGEAGHTFIYVGNIEGFNSNIASASYSSDGTKGRAPMAAKDSLTKSYSTNDPVRWYRKEGDYGKSL